MGAAPEQWIVVRNWEKFQHYRDRHPTWIKVYTELLDDPAYLGLTWVQRGLLHGLWLWYAMSRGCVPLDLKMINRKLNCNVKMRTVEALNHAGFIEFSASKPLPIGYLALAREEKRREMTESDLSSSTSPTTRGAGAPRPKTGRAPARPPDQEDDDMANGKPRRPTIDVIRDLIRNGGHTYTDEAILDEITLQERKRGDRVTDQQRTELLELANTLRNQPAA